MWLAYGTWRESASATAAGGMATTAAWVFGGRAAPVTGRADVQVTRELAESERIAAQLVLHEVAGLPRFPAVSECAALGVVFVAPRLVSSEWARGVEATLRWLLGRRGVDGRTAPAPLVLPSRHDDGTLASAHELYERAVAAAVLAPMPHERSEMYRRAESDVERSRRLDERIRSLQVAAARSG